MLTLTPDYYSRFRCAAGDCRHTCCASWEIDIDEDTLRVYDALPGPLGGDLRAAVQREPTAHFRLAADERCPFLREDGLCRLIAEGGEALLCQICRDHPRFRTFLPGRTEIGLGLCCESAGRLILTRREPMRLLMAGTPDPAEDGAALIALRDRLLALAGDRTRPLRDREADILTEARGRLPQRSWAAWADFYLSLERLEPGWTELLQLLGAKGDSVDIIQFKTHMTGRETEYEQLLTYFLFRHFLKGFDDGDCGGKAAFAVLSTELIFTLGAILYTRRGRFTVEDQVELARQYSAEIEYSEENLDALYDELFNDPWND